MDNIGRWSNKSSPEDLGTKIYDRIVSQMRTPLTACRELMVDYDTFPKLLYIIWHQKHTPNEFV